MMVSRSSHRRAVRCVRWLVVAMGMVAVLPGEASSQVRAPYAPRTGVTLDGQLIHHRSVSGGWPHGELVVAPGPDGMVKKQIAGLRPDPVVLELGLGDKPVLDWIAASWSGSNNPKALRVLQADFNYKAEGGIDLSDAVIAETGVPALDGASKDAGYLTLVLLGRAAPVPPSGEDIRGSMSKATQWLTSNFRFELGDLPGNRVARIEPFTVRTAQLPAGAADAQTQRGVERLKRPAAAVDFPNLTISVSAADLKPWRSWYEDFVLKGNNGDHAEKNGAIVLLAPNMQTTLARIALSNCGILSLDPWPEEGGRAARFTVELYCERMALEPVP